MTSKGSEKSPNVRNYKKKTSNSPP